MEKEEVWENFSVSMKIQGFKGPITMSTIQKGTPGERLEKKKGEAVERGNFKR